MKLLCVGDVHTNIEALQELISTVDKDISAVLQVGDFELYQSKASIDQEKKYLEILLAHVGQEKNINTVVEELLSRYKFCLINQSKV